MSQFQNPFVWHDLLTSKVAEAKSFYADVVGWTYLVHVPDYHVALVQDHGVGGIMTAPEYLHKMPPFWSGYIYTPSVDQACKRVEELGGTIFRAPWDVPDVLRMAVIADPTGAAFNIMQPLTKEERTVPKEGALGTVGWNELHAGDPNTAWDFYAGMFGWTKGASLDMGRMGAYQIFQINGKDAGAVMNKGSGMQRPMWNYYFIVDGIDAAAARITKSGGNIAMGPHLVPGGQWIVSAFDPQGGNFQLLSATK
jgi:uncharacterized protein